MLKPKYHIHLNGKYFETIYPVDHYNDKKVFFDSGAKQFFTIYQLACSGKHELAIEKTETNSKLVINDEIQFMDWVAKNYPMYLSYLENYI